MAKTFDYFTKLCSYIPNHSKSDEDQVQQHRLERNLDSEVKKEFGVTYNQIETGSKIVLLLYTCLLLLFINYVKVSLTALGILVLMGLYIYNYLKSYPREIIEFRISKVESMLYLLKMDVDLIARVNLSFEDPLIKLIDLFHYSYPELSNSLSEIKKSIRRGVDIEDSLQNIESPSQKIRDFFSHMVMYISDPRYFQFNQSSSMEMEYQTFSKGLETRLNILFFIGVFFPLGLGFMMILGKIDVLTLLLSVPFFGFILYYAKKKIMSSNISLIGSTNDISQAEKDEFKKVLEFYRSLSFNLARFPPETAIIVTSESLAFPLSPGYNDMISSIKKYTMDYNEFFKSLTNDLSNTRSKILLQNLPVLINQNSENVSNAMLKTLEVVEKHLALQNEREVIINAEKIKATLFSNILPIILGFLSTVFLFFTKLSMGIEGSDSLFSMIERITPVHLVVFIISQFIMIGQVVSKFSEIFGLKSPRKRIITAQIIYLVTFFMTFIILTVTSQNLLIV